MDADSGKKGFFENIRDFYDKHYKGLLIITLLLIILAVGQIAFQTITTGDFMSKGISLKGGITISILKDVNALELEKYLQEKFPGLDVSVREISQAGIKKGVIIEMSEANSDKIIKVLEQKIKGLSKEDYSIEIMGSSLGESFFKETFKTIIIAFLFMGVVVFIYFASEFWPRVFSFILGIAGGFLVYYSSNIIILILAIIDILLLLYIFFKYSIPSVFVILCAFCDIIETLAVVNLLGMKISTAGVAAFLMLIGYSVDTDILLTTRVLKRKQESIFESTFGALKTGLMLTITAIIAVVIALIFAQADVLKEIMIIVLIGLLFDIVNTWIQNAGILRWYLERKKRHVKA